MSHVEIEYTSRVLRGEEKLVRGSGDLDMMAVMYLESMAATPEFEQEVRQLIGEHFDRRLQKCMRAVVPPLLDILRNRKVVYVISNHMHFIAVSCPRHGLPISEFTSMEELHKLWREAHLRSAIKGSKHINGPNRGRWVSTIASATLAGILPEEIGVSRAEANKCVDEYFYRNEPKLKDIWGAHKKDYDQMNKLFATV